MNCLRNWIKNQNMRLWSKTRVQSAETRVQRNEMTLDLRRKTYRILKPSQKCLNSSLLDLRRKCFFSHSELHPPLACEVQSAETRVQRNEMTLDLRRKTYRILKTSQKCLNSSLLDLRRKCFFSHSELHSPLACEVQSAETRVQRNEMTLDLRRKELFISHSELHPPLVCEVQSAETRVQRNEVKLDLRRKESGSFRILNSTHLWRVKSSLPRLEFRGTK